MRIIKGVFLGALVSLMPIVANAHAFGQQFTLPLPFSLYAMGAAVALVASFVFLGLYSNPVSMNAPYVVRRFVFKMNTLYFIGGLIGYAALASTFVLVLFGSNDFFSNPAPIIFWIGLLLGVTYLSAIIGGIWPLLNPFERVVRFFLKRRTRAHPFPERYRYAPVLVLYYVLIWMELLSYGIGAMPWTIGVMLLIYLCISFVGAFVYGVDEWFQYGDLFNALFGMIAQFAPIQISREGVEVMPPGERLVEKSVVNAPLLLFILFFLSSTAFDGLQETQLWWTTMYRFPIQINLYPFERALVLAASPLIFFALYASAIWLMMILTHSVKRFMSLALRFGYSLIPIAVAYSFAHYFMILVNESQTFIAQISDPFATGADLFGTANLPVSITLISAKAVWYTQLTVIIVGHIIATYVAHRIALREFDSRTKVIVGQLPVLLLMVLYTVFGLWILSQGYQNGA